MIILNKQHYLEELHKETMLFFQNIFISKEMQEEYDLINYENKEFVLNTIKQFKESPTACIVKPFYEKNYSDKTIPSSIIVKRDSNGFITSTSSLNRTEPSIIEPFRFVSIIKQLIEDETIKKEMYSEKETSYETDFSI